MLRSICLDLGTKPGFARRLGDQIIIGANDFSPRRGEGAGMRFIRFRKWLDRLYDQSVFGLVYYEQAAGSWQNKGPAEQIFGGFMAILQSWCEEHGIAYSGVQASRIKLFATGKVIAKKELVTEWATAKALALGVVGDRTPDALDALALLLLTESETFD